MKLQKKILAVAVAAAFAGIAAQAQAGTASATYNTYAVEALPTLSSVASPSAAFQTDIVIAAGTDFTMFFKLDNGAKFTGATDITKFVLQGAGATGADLAATTATLVDSGNVLRVNFPTTSTSVPTGTLINIAAGAFNMNLSGAASALSTGGQVKMTTAIVNGASNAETFPTTGIIDSATGTIANAAEALKGTFKAAEPGVRIDVAELAKKFTTDPLTTSTTLVNLGSFKIDEVAGTQLDNESSPNEDFTLDDTGLLKFTVAGSFIDDDNDATTTPAAVHIDIDANCATAAVATTTYNSTTGNYEGSYDTAGGDIAKGTTYYVCYTVSGEEAIPETLPKLTGIKLTDTAGTTTYKTFADTNLLELKLNGSEAQLINYVPAAAAPYQTYVRLANNGKVDANLIQVTFIGANGTTLGTGTLPALPKGASKTYSAAELEAAAGVTLAAGDRPQVKVYAVTDKLGAQSYMADPNGGYTNMTFDTGMTY